ncbi:MAG: hypothetical protein WCI02_01115 [Planctomycetota bacterium]
MKRTSWQRSWIRTGRWTCVALVAASVGLPATASAQDKSAPAKTAAAIALPAGEKILDEYANAIGGKEALGKFKTRRSEGVLEMKSVGLEGKMLLLQSQPDKLVLRFDIPNVGKHENGFDGKIAWEDSVISGGRELEGEEKDQIVRRALFDGDHQWRKVYEKATTKGEDKVGDRPVWVVELKPIGSDKLQTNYYDKESKLLLRSKMTAATPMGEIAIENDFLDYRDLDGIKMPFESRQNVLGQTQVMRFTKITHDEPIEDSVFSPKK